MTSSHTPFGLEEEGTGSSGEDFVLTGGMVKELEIWRMGEASPCFCYLLVTTFPGENPHIVPGVCGEL